MPQLHCPGLLGLTLQAPGRATHSGRATGLPRAQWEAGGAGGRPDPSCRHKNCLCLSAAFNTLQVQATLGVTGHKWCALSRTSTVLTCYTHFCLCLRADRSDCNHGVAIGFELGGDWMQSYQQMLPDQLAAGIRVLMYAGDQDYICNWLGNQAWSQY